MKYMTVKEASEKWGYMVNHISRLCKNGFIPGAIKGGDGYNAPWLIPEDTPKPPDRRVSEFKAPLKSDEGYMTVGQASKKWDICESCIAKFCAEGRINGVIKKRSIWMIPEDAEYPENPRRTIPEGYMSVQETSEISGLPIVQIEFLCKYNFIDGVKTKCEQYIIPESAGDYLRSLEARQTYRTVEETAKEWGCTRDNVTYILRQGRVRRAVKKGKFWFIPADTEKPTSSKGKPRSNAVKISCISCATYADIFHLTRKQVIEDCENGIIKNAVKENGKWRIYIRLHIKQ